MGIIYLTTNKINGRKYIGVDTKNNKYYFGSGTAIKLAIKKYGTENFTKEIIESSDDKQYLFEREKYWINYYDAVNSHDFYNMSTGGKGGNMLINEKSIQKHKEGSEKGLNKVIENRKGKTYEEIYGDKANEEKEKRKQSLLGKKHNQERKNKILNTLKGKSTNNHCLKGRIPWNKGLTKESDIRVKKNSENAKRHKYLKIYELVTPTNEKLFFNGRNQLKEYLKNININFKIKSRINCDKLIKDGYLNGYSIIIKKGF